MNLTVEALKHLAAGAVAEFNCKGTPLNEGIMKIASENQFNPEQIKRLVEASNQIAYQVRIGLNREAYPNRKMVNDFIISESIDESILHQINS